MDSFFATLVFRAGGLVGVFLTAGFLVADVALRELSDALLFEAANWFAESGFEAVFPFDPSLVVFVNL